MLQEPTLEQILDLEHTWPVYVIMLFVALVLMVIASWYLYRAYQERSDDTKQFWRALTGTKSKLPGYNEIRIKPVKEPEIYIQGGEVYVLRSDIIQTALPEEQPFSLQEGEELTEQKVKDIVPIKNEQAMFERQWDVITQKVQAKLPTQRYIEHKIETYLHMDRKSKHIIGFQVPQLFTNQTVLSKMAYIPVAAYKTGTPKIMYILLAISVLWNIIINTSLMIGQVPDFVLQPYMYGWYACLGLIIAVQVYLWRTQKGHWGIFWAPHRVDIEVNFGYRDQSFQKTIPIYYIEPLYHMGIDIASVFGADIDELLQGINQTLAQQISKVISENISLKNEKERVVTLVEELRSDLDEARLSLRQQKILAYFEYMADAQVPPIGEAVPLGGSWVDNLSTLKWPAALVIVSAFAYFGFDSLFKLVEGWSLNSMDKLLLGLVGLIILGVIGLILWISVMSYVRKSPTGA